MIVEAQQSHEDKGRYAQEICIPLKGNDLLKATSRGFCSIFPQ
jgi:hypothetical protein